MAAERISMKTVLMLASENASLKNGKVGGVGDVIRDLPRALADLGWNTTIITPSYGFLHLDNPSREIGSVRFPFSGKIEEAIVFEVTPRIAHAGVRNLVVEHPRIRGTPIYSNDPPGQAFASDATKYALFCSAIGQYLKTTEMPAVLHLHDWHTPFLLLLRELHPQFSHLKDVKTVFTIHNLAIQGNRPLRGSAATVEQWFPEIFSDSSWMNSWKDPRYTEPNFTPMAAGIRLADRVNTVSPTYAEEIVHPSNPSIGSIRGEGLEGILQTAKAEGRLFGILNGCEYPANRIPRRLPFPELCDVFTSEVGSWKKKLPDPVHDQSLERITELKKRRPSVILTSVTRVVEQKIKILHQPTSRRKPVMAEICSLLSTVNGIYIVLGTGTPDYEDRMAEMMRRCPNCLYLKGFSEPIGEVLYANGMLFMMPSSFEPCGIGQMLAMRDGQPCLVHAVGGLKDTVTEGKNGFTFLGATLLEQADLCVEGTHRAIKTKLEQPDLWNRIVQEALESRFTWEKSAREYIDRMYL